MRAIIALSALAFGQCFMPAYAAESVLLGKVIANVYTGESDECPADSICLSGWYRWTITVSKTVSGPDVSGTVAAARMQHGEFLLDRNEVEKRLRHEEDFVFVLEKIIDAEKRAKLEADYYILDLSPPLLMYCLDKKPREFGFPTDDFATLKYPHETSYCFDLPHWYE